jgi:hypothetical protein
MTDPNPQLNVNPQFLEQLAGAQSTAASDISRLTSDTSLVKDLWVTHGVYVGAGNQGIAEAVGARKNAGEAMGNYFNSLADRLHTSASIYADADQEQAQNLSTQTQNS